MSKLLYGVGLSALVLPCAVMAQLAADWEAEVRQFDTRYWQAYNECEIAKLAAMNTDDLEFYHDIGGVSKGKAKFSELVAKNICGRPGMRIRREAIADSMHFYPMRDGEKLYGAIVSGEHRFYERPNGGWEVLTGQARFTHMLLLQEGQWKVARVLSFAHGPARVQTVGAEANIDPVQLDRLNGHYVEKMASSWMSAATACASRLPRARP